MKTAQTIEEQGERKQAPGNEGISPATTPPAREKLKQRDASRIAPWRWKKGQSGNPSGARHDVARVIARAVFEENAEALYRALAKAALRGNAYCFKELADRAYGKLKEVHQVDVPFKGVPAADLEKEITRLEILLGYRKAEESEAPPLTSDSSTFKPN